MAGCWTGDCGRRDQLTGGPGMVYDAQARTWSCYMCHVMPTLFPQPARRVDEDQAQGEALEEKGVNVVRDGVFDIMQGKRVDPTFHKRNRAGPLWVPPANRV